MQALCRYTGHTWAIHRLYMAFVQLMHGPYGLCMIYIWLMFVLCSYVPSYPAGVFERAFTAMAMAVAMARLGIADLDSRGFFDVGEWENANHKGTRLELITCLGFQYFGGSNLNPICKHFIWITLSSLDRHIRLKQIDMAITLDHELHLTWCKSWNMQNF